MRVLPCILALVACGGADIQIEPASVDLGEVDFQPARPDAGHEATPVTLTHLGGPDVDLVLRDVDDRITVQARLVVEDPPTLPTLAEGDSFVLTVGAWDYEAGERGSEVSGVFRLTGDGLAEDLQIPWSFTPVRDQGD